MIPTMDTEVIGSEWAGRLIDGKYPLLQWLGGSESGSVFLTESQKIPGQRLAIRLLPAGDPGAEARIAGWTTATTLSHPHLMPIFDCGRCRAGDTWLIYAVTLYSEELLSQILAERPLTPAEVEDLLKPIIDALSYLHGNGFVHGHLKPSNLMVVGDQLKLSSDRLEAVGSSGAHHKPANVYDAPERDRETISPAADVWSLGVTLIETLVQHPPGWKPSMTRAPIVPKAVPEPYAAIAGECLRRRPANRCTLSDIWARLAPEPVPQIEPAPAAVPETVTEAVPDPAAETVPETAAEAAPESIAEIAPKPAAGAPAEAAAETATESPEEATTETVEKVAMQSAAEPATDSTAEPATELVAETTTEQAKEATPQPAANAAAESAAQSEAVAQPEPTAETAEEAATEPVPEFVPEPVSIPEPAPARFRINSQNTILLGMLGLLALLSLVFHFHQSTSPAGNEPQSSVSSAQTANPQTANPQTVPGTVISQVLPDVKPSDSAKISSTIEVKVLVTVDPKGEIEDTILNVPGPSPHLAALARQAAQKWTFKPAFKSGHPIQSLWILEFQFSRNSTKIIPFEVSP